MHCLVHSMRRRGREGRASRAKVVVAESLLPSEDALVLDPFALEVVSCGPSEVVDLLTADQRNRESAGGHRSDGTEGCWRVEEEEIGGRLTWSPSG